MEILLVEDEPGDVRLIIEALKEARFKYKLCPVSDGEAAMDYLLRRNKYAGVHAPDMIMLDLNLPKKNGAEILKEIKGNPELKHIPVVILTTSNASDDIVNTYKLQANSYIAKPFEIDNFNKIVHSLENYWLFL